MSRESSYIWKIQDFQKMDKLRIVMLYALRYETNSSNELTNFIEKLFQAGLDKDTIALVSALLKYAGNNQRSGDLFLKNNLFKFFKKNLTRGIKGVENIYTEHKPYLKELIDNILVGKLKEADFPYVQGTKVSPGSKPPQDIIVFIVGGMTYDEALIVHEYSANPSLKVVIGGTSIHNSTSFLKDVGIMASSMDKMVSLQ